MQKSLTGSHWQSLTSLIHPLCPGLLSQLLWVGKPMTLAWWWHGWPTRSLNPRPWQWQGQSVVESWYKFGKHYNFFIPGFCFMTGGFTKRKVPALLLHDQLRQQFLQVDSETWCPTGGRHMSHCKYPFPWDECVMAPYYVHRIMFCYHPTGRE